MFGPRARVASSRSDARLGPSARPLRRSSTTLQSLAHVRMGWSLPDDSPMRDHHTTCLSRDPRTPSDPEGTHLARPRWDPWDPTSLLWQASAVPAATGTLPMRVDLANLTSHLTAREWASNARPLHTPRQPHALFLGA